MPRVVHFYHLWTGGDWESIFEEHQSSLKSAEFDGEVIVNKVSSGFEDVTLNLLRNFCLTANPDTPVLYMHAKGSFNRSYLRDKDTGVVTEVDQQALWRRHMTDRLLFPWRSRVRKLLEVDALGCHWTVPPEAQVSMFAGNFWWARAGFIATLPELPKLDGTNRWLAEQWLGRGNPTVCALSEGFASIPMPATPGSANVEWVKK